MNGRLRRLTIALATAAALAGGAAHAKTFRVADQGDALSMDPHSLNESVQLSFTGNVTFKANDHLREAARLAPAGQILVETDAPYMAPEPFRGARNEVGLVGYTARAIAEVRGQEPEEFVAEVAETARKVFGLRA